MRLLPTPWDIAERAQAAGPALNGAYTLCALVIALAVTWVLSAFVELPRDRLESKILIVAITIPIYVILLFVGPSIRTWLKSHQP